MASRRRRFVIGIAGGNRQRKTTPDEKASCNNLARKLQFWSHDNTTGPYNDLPLRGAVQSSRRTSGF